MKKYLFLILLLSACTSFYNKEKIDIKTKVAFVPKPSDISFFPYDNSFSIENIKTEEAFKVYFALYGFNINPKELKGNHWLFYYKHQYYPKKCFIGKLKAVLTTHTPQTLIKDMPDVVEINICHDMDKNIFVNELYKIIPHIYLGKEETKSILCNKTKCEEVK